MQNSVKDGIRVEASDGVTFRRIKATWDTAEQSTNGAYGIYPVKSKHVLVEDSIATNASDAGLYVGQCQNVIVRNNEVFGNVAGLEIENTQYADVYENDVHDNTGGLVIFDLPGNPIVGRDIRVRDNHVHDNNGTNFAPGGTVAAIPVGTGTFAMASRRVEIKNNNYERNNTVDIAIVSGLIIEKDMSKWTLDTTSSMFVGSVTDLSLLPGFDAQRRADRRREHGLELPQREHRDLGQHARGVGHQGRPVRSEHARPHAQVHLRWDLEAGRQRRLRHDRGDRASTRTTTTCARAATPAARSPASTSRRRTRTSARRTSAGMHRRSVPPRARSSTAPTLSGPALTVWDGN